MTDEVVTHAEVMRWLPYGIARDLEMAMPPDQRGWYTADEAREDGGRFVEARTLSEIEGRYYRTGS